MSTHLTKNLLKKFVSLTGVVSASAFFCTPAFALSSFHTSGSQAIATRTEQTNSTASSTDVLAQTKPGEQPSTSPSRERDNQSSPTPPSGSDRPKEPASTGGRDRVYERPTTDRTNTNNRLLTGGDWVRGVNYQCLNNPNPQCRS